MKDTEEQGESEESAGGQKEQEEAKEDEIDGDREGRD
jgi:hypothetical protein